MTAITTFVRQIQERAALNQMIEDGELGRCVECDQVTERFDSLNEDWCCESCHETIIEGQRRDEELDDPRHGQARYLNRGER